MRRSMKSFVLAVVLVAAPAFAGETVTNQAARVSIAVPEAWSSKVSGESVTLTDPKKDTAVSFSLVESGDLKDASKRLAKHLDAKVQKLTWVKEEKVDVNGMKGVFLDGDGFIGDKNIDLALLILDTPNPDKDLLVLAIAEDAVLAKHKGEIRSIFRGLKPLK